MYAVALWKALQRGWRMEVVLTCQMGKVEVNFVEREGREGSTMVKVEPKGENWEFHER
jgi:hypothetical protein